MNAEPKITLGSTATGKKLHRVFFNQPFCAIENVSNHFFSRKIKITKKQRVTYAEIGTHENLCAKCFTLDDIARIERKASE